MRIYLDVVILLNFFFDFLLILSVGIILKRQTNIKRILFSSLIGSFSILFLFIKITSFMLFIVKVIISILMILIAYGYRDIRYTSRNLFYFYTSSIILGGFLYLINNQLSYKSNGLVFYYNGFSINFIVLIILSPLIIYIYIKQIKLLKNNYSNYYNVDIYFKDGSIVCATAFLDTGNKLYDPFFRKPIILINKKDVKFNYEDSNVLLVPYDTANKHSLMKCIVPDKIYIDNVGIKRNFLVGITDEIFKIDGVDCILHSKLLEG